MEQTRPSTVQAIAAIVGSVVLAGLACSGAPLGGRGAGGRGGDSGAGGLEGTDAGSSAICSELTDAYAAAVAAALACTPGAPNQCQAPVAIAPTACPGAVCGGQELVNDTTEVEMLRGEWLAACEPGVHISCVAIACDPPPPPSVCVPSGGAGTTGTCVPYGSDAGAAVVPDGGESCDQLAADYAAAVIAARRCTPGAPNQCQSYVTQNPPAGPDPVDCQRMTAVNDTTGVTAALQRWSAQCQGPGFILLIKCDPPAPGQGSCVPDVDAGAVSGSTGTCVPTLLD